MYTGSKITFSQKAKTTLVILLTVGGMLVGAIPLVTHVPSTNGASLLGAALVFSALWVSANRNTSREYEDRTDV